MSVNKDIHTLAGSQQEKLVSYKPHKSFLLVYESWFLVT